MKKIASIILSILIVFSLYGCKDNQQSQNSTHESRVYLRCINIYERIGATLTGDRLIYEVRDENGVVTLESGESYLMSVGVLLNNGKQVTPGFVITDDVDSVFAYDKERLYIERYYNPDYGVTNKFLFRALEPTTVNVTLVYSTNENPYTFTLIFNQPQDSVN